MATAYLNTKTPEDIRDLWSTPQWVFDYFNAEFNFGLDVAASSLNTKVRSAYLTEEDDALSKCWADCVDPNKSNIAWCNPPYSNITPWMKHAEFEAKNLGLTTVLFVPNTTDSGWWPRNASEVRQICGLEVEGKRNKSGRIGFVRADTGEEQRGNNKGSCLIIFSPFTLGNMTTKYIGIEELLRGDL